MHPGWHFSTGAVPYFKFVIADFVGEMLAVPEGNGEGLDVKVDDGSRVGKTT